MKSRRPLLIMPKPSLLFAFLIPFVLVVISVLNVYYDSGDMVDTRLCSFIAWHNNWRLVTPPLFVGSFFDIHISPIFWLTNIVSYLQPFGQIAFYAICMGGIYGLFAAGIHQLWRLHDDREKPRYILVALLIALGVTFSAAGMQALRLPHIEMAMPVFMLWFCYALVQQKIRMAFAFFVLCLLVREDAGLHLFGLLTLWALAAHIWKLEHPSKGLLWLFAGLALTYAVGVLFAKSFIFTGTNNLSYIYTGAKPWEHLTSALIGDRLYYFVTERTWIWIPGFITLIWGYYSRNPLLPIAHLAAVPWLIINLLAAQEPAGGLNFYYAFPFWFALAWPLVAWQCRVGGGRGTSNTLYVILLFFSLFGWQDDQPVFYPAGDHGFDGSPFAINKTLFHQSETQSFSDYFRAHQDHFDDVALDTPAMAMTLNDNTKLRWIGAWDRTHKKPPAVIIYYVNSIEWPRRILPLVTAGTYSYYYEIRGTNLRAISQGPLEKTLPQPYPFRATKWPVY